MGPCIVVMPDTFTSLGGNQFIDSEIMGDWGAWLSTDLISELRSKFKIYAFGLTGFSSGGYGAMVRGMLDSAGKPLFAILEIVDSNWFTQAAWQMASLTSLNMEASYLSLNIQKTPTNFPAMTFTL